MREYKAKQLLEVVSVTTATTAGGSYIDTQDYIGHGGREAKFVLMVGTGTTAGTAAASVQSASDTAGTGLQTVCTFTTITTVGGINEQHGVLPATHRYVRAVYAVQATKDMLMGMIMLQQERYSP